MVFILTLYQGGEPFIRMDTL